jgi:hypothetical protein
MISGANMKMSGWVRVWIVASVIWWAGGAVWLSRVNFSGLVMPSLSYSYDGLPPCREEHLGGLDWDRVYAGGCLPPDTVASFRVGWEKRWRAWFDLSWKEGHLPLVLFGPFILGALMLGVSWIIRGFRPQPAKSVADANKPPPVGPSPSDGV